MSLSRLPREAARIVRRAGWVVNVSSPGGTHGVHAKALADIGRRRGVRPSLLDVSVWPHGGSRALIRTAALRVGGIRTGALRSRGELGKARHQVGLAEDGGTLGLGGMLSVLKGQDEIFFFDV